MLMPESKRMYLSGIKNHNRKWSKTDKPFRTERTQNIQPFFARKVQNKYNFLDKFQKYVTDYAITNRGIYLSKALDVTAFTLTENRWKKLILYYP